MTTTQLTRHGGGNVMVDKNNIPELLASLNGLKKSTVAFGQELMERSMERVQESDGFGTWEPIHPATVAYETARGAPNPSKLMEGVTLTLTRNLDKFPITLNSGLPTADVEGHVGWDGSQHPDPGVFGDQRAAAVPTIGQLALIHELGVRQGGVLGLSFESGAGSEFRVPQRRWASLAADRDAKGILTGMTTLLGNEIMAFNSLPIRP